MKKLKAVCPAVLIAKCVSLQTLAGLVKMDTTYQDLDVYKDVLKDNSWLENDNFTINATTVLKIV